MNTFASAAGGPCTEDPVRQEFLEILDQCAEAYSTLSDSTFSFLSRTRAFRGNLDTLFFDTLSVTVTSIKALIVAGAFSDAYTLLRRFSEISWLHVSVMLRLHEPSAMDELLGDDEGEVTAERLSEIWERGFYVNEIEAWLADTSPLPKNKKFERFASSTAAKAVYALLDRERLCAIGERCNDHVHLNH